LHTAIFADSDNFICGTKWENMNNSLDSYYLPNERYPIFIMIQLGGRSIEYFPIGWGYGFTCDIKQIMITSVEKHILYGEKYMYFVDADVL